MSRDAELGAVPARTGELGLDRKIAPTSVPDEAAVAAWFRALRERGVAFHPEESFAGIVNSVTRRPTFNHADARRLDALMEQANSVCNACGVALRVFAEAEEPALRLPADEPIEGGGHR